MTQTVAIDNGKHDRKHGGDMIREYIVVDGSGVRELVVRI